MRVRQPGLLVATLVGVAILLSLGWWQKQRLEWKRGVIAEVEAAATADPFTSLAEVEAALAAGKPVDFRRIAVPVSPVEGAPLFRVFRAGGGINWEVFTPVRSGDHTVFAGLGLVPDGAPVEADVPGRLLGHVRLDRGPVRGELASNPDANRYYSVNPDGLWSAAAPGTETRYWIDADPALTDPRTIPVRRPDLPNRHFEYMLTWWSFALILVVISTILYRRGGRAGT